MMKVLIVEDDKVLGLLLSKMVEKIGLEILALITEGRKAIEKTKELNPDLILMDIMLADDVDGIQAMEKIRTFNSEVRVIFVTGNSDQYNRKRAEQVDYTDYLIKPITIDELQDSIALL